MIVKNGYSIILGNTQHGVIVRNPKRKIINNGPTPPEPDNSDIACLNLAAGLYKKKYEGYFYDINEFFDSTLVSSISIGDIGKSYQILDIGTSTQQDWYNWGFVESPQYSTPEALGLPFPSIGKGVSYFGGGPIENAGTANLGPVLVSESVTSQIDDNYSQAQGQNNKSLIIKGYFKPTVNGVYKFRLYSDDASYLWFGNDALDGNRTTSNAVVSLPGIHGPYHTDPPGTFTMVANSYYPLTVEFGNGPDGEGVLIFDYMPPGSDTFTSDLAGKLFYDIDSKGHRVCAPRSAYFGRVLSLDAVPYDRNPNQIVFDSAGVPTVNGVYVYTQTGSPIPGSMFHNTGFYGPVVSGKNNLIEFDVQSGTTGYFVGDWALQDYTYFNTGNIPFINRIEVNESIFNVSGVYTRLNSGDNAFTIDGLSRKIIKNNGTANATADALGYWKLDNSLDSSIGNNTFSKNGNGSITYSNGIINNGIVFNGSYSLSASFGTYSQFSYSVWVKGGTQTSPYSEIFLGGDADIQFGGENTNGSNTIGTFFQGTYLFNGTKVVTDNNWHHVVLTWDGNIVKIYVDGILDQSAENTSASINLSNFTIGGQRLEIGEWSFNGTIDEVAIWDRVLSENEIIDLYKNPNIKWLIQDDDNITRYINDDINLDPNLWYTIESRPLGTKTDGLLGIQYSGYFDNDPTWFNTATVQPIITGLTLSGAEENANGTYINSNYLNQGTYRFDVIPNPELYNEGNYIIFNPDNQITGERYWGLYVTSLEQIFYKSYDLINWTNIEGGSEGVPKLQSSNTINSENSTLFSTSRSVMNGTSWEWVGYFRPQNTSDHSFNMYADENAYFWIGDKALNGYTTGNADMFSSGYIQATVTNLALVSGVNYPVRMQWGHPANPTNAGLNLGYNDGINAGNNFSGLFFNSASIETSEKHFPQSILITGAGTSYYDDIYTTTATGRGDFTAKIVITGATQSSSNGIYTRVNSGDNFIGPNGNYININLDGPQIYGIYDNTVKEYTYIQQLNYGFGWDIGVYYSFITLEGPDPQDPQYGTFLGDYTRSVYGKTTFNGPNGNNIVWNNSLNRWELLNNSNILIAHFLDGDFGNLSISWFSWDVAWDNYPDYAYTNDSEFGTPPISLNLPNTTYYGQNDPYNVLFWTTDNRWILSNITKQNWIGDEAVGYYLCNGTAGSSYSNDLIFDDKHWEPDVASDPGPTGSFVANPNFNSINSNGYFYDFTLGQWQVTNPAYEQVPDVYYSHVWLDSISGFNNSGVMYTGNKHVILVNNPTYSSGYSGIYSFNGIDQYAITQEVVQSADRSFSHFIWFKPTGAGVIISELGQPEINNYYHDSQLEINEAGEVHFGVYAYNGYITSNPIDFNRWYHFGLTYSSGVLSAYINGQKIASNNSERYPASAPLYYGICAADSTNMGVSGYGKGFVGSFQAYNTGLTEIQVGNLYSGEKDRFPNIDNIFSPSLWLKADAGVISNNSNVSVWQDQSNNGNNASINNGEPLFENNVINSKPAIYLDGGSTMITTEFLPLINTTPVTMFGVIKANGDDVRDQGRDGRWLMNVTNANDYIFGFNFGPFESSDPVTASLMVGSSYTNQTDIQDSQPFGNPEAALCTAINDGTTISYFKNGSLKGTTESENYSSSSNYGRFGLGAQITPNRGNPVLNAKCYIAEVIIYNRALTTSERQEVENYLSNKYAISLA